MEVGWIPRWNYQISPTGSNYLGHYARTYQFRDLNPGETAFITEYLKKLRSIYAHSINPIKLKKLTSALTEDFILFPLQLANDFNLKFSDTEFSKYYSATGNNNTMLAQACIEKATAAVKSLPIIFKQHPFDHTQGLQNIAGNNALILDNSVDISSHEIFATGRCKAVISINSNTLHEAAVWGIPCISLGKLIWNRNTSRPPFASSFEELDRVLQTPPMEDTALLAYLHYLVENQWTLNDFQNPRMVEELVQTKGLCSAMNARAKYGLLQ